MQRRLVLAGGLVAAALTAIVLTASIASAASGNIGFGFNARNISGFRTGSATLTGGGSYNPVTGFVKSAGGFRCTNDIGQGPLKGCLSGEGVRWDTVNLLRSTTFKCTGSAAETLKTATTDENTAVIVADFYRAGDGNVESFTGQIIVSADDIAPDIDGLQNVWIQGIGCASSIANFSS
ncbi:MAG: hypothetical protein E6H99_01590 [Chloroflexi bacterium]|nr:MAG: hypothetical protein E6H99_01590 [Chloroflexota bacterium]TMG67429.1 MAG: hypothetical protein E6H82_05665 [Chloroflexota bacterium]